jgi:hypothetical protein
MPRWPMVWVCVTCLTAGLLLPVEQPQALRPRLKLDALFVNAPDLHVLEGRIAEKLKNGTGVALDYHLALFAGSRTIARRRTFERFSFSYDLWEENYTVSTLRNPRSAASRMTAREAERWCLDHLPMLVTGLGVNEEFWLRLEIRAAQVKNDADWLSDEGLNLGRLIDALGRIDGRKPDQWVREAGPFRLRDFPAPGRTP